jgi:ABC-2 type transporter
VLATFAVLIAAGAFDAPAAGRAWVVIGGFGIGLAYGLPQVRAEFGVLRAERFAGLNASSYVLAKLAILLPALATADAIALLVPLAWARLPAGYGSSYLTLLLCSAVALGLALLLSAALPGPGTPPTAVAALCLPPLLLAGAILTLLDRPIWPDWTVLAASAACLLVAVTALTARRAPAARPAGARLASQGRSLWWLPLSPAFPARREGMKDT